MAFYCLFEILFKLIPVIISATVAMVAYLQYRTQRNQLKLDLYNRRFAVYEKTINYYSLVINFCKGIERLLDGNLSNDKAALIEYLKTLWNNRIQEVETEFIKSFRESVFLFGNKSLVYYELSEFQNKVNNFVDYEIKKQVDIRLNQDVVFDSNKGYATKGPELNKVIQKNMESIEIAMKKWLDFKKISAH